VQDGGNSLTVDGTVAATQSGTWAFRAQDGTGNAITSQTAGALRPWHVIVTDTSGNPITSFGGSGGTASNIGSAFPSAATAIGFNDGTNMQGGRVFDGDTGAGASWIVGTMLRASASGGTVEAGTAANPLRFDPTGTTTQPVSISGTLGVNVSQFGGNAANLGAGNAGTGTPRFVLATDQVALAGLGAGATGSGVPANAIYQGINVGGNQRGQTGVNPTGTVYAAQVDIASVGGSTASYVADISGDADTGAGTSTMVMYGIGFPASGGPVFWPGDATNGGKVQVTQLPNVSIAPAQSLTATSSTAGNFMSALGATASTTDATVECPIVSAATNNATNCKASPGNLYGYEIYNTTTTTYYLRLYNTASAPTCSSATGFVRSIPIPAASAAGQVGGLVRLTPVPVGFSTGISYCLTAGSANNDNTSAATGVFGAAIYK
jgi:hypothetical protein